MAHYTTDLVASVCVALLIGWLVQSSASDLYLRNALVTQNEVYVAISRFTPRNLAPTYTAALEQMSRNLAFGYPAAGGFSAAIEQALITVLQLMVGICLAVPRTLLSLYQQASGPAAWTVLAGFGMAIGTVFTALLANRRSVWRLLLAIAVTPLAISVLFMILQAFMVLMLDAFFWLTWLAPYTVACPVLCTLYWVAFPHTDRGAAATLVRAIGRVLEPQR